MDTVEIDHAGAAEQLQSDILTRMTPGKRLEVARGLYEAAWQIKAAGLRREHPDWPEQRLLDTLRRIFVTGYAGA